MAQLPIQLDQFSISKKTILFFFFVNFFFYCEVVFKWREAFTVHIDTKKKIVPISKLFVNAKCIHSVKKNYLLSAVIWSEASSFSSIFNFVLILSLLMNDRLEINFKLPFNEFHSITMIQRWLFICIFID